MEEIEEPPLRVLGDVERACLLRYVETLVTVLGEDLAAVWLFGSVARDEAWPRGMRIRSDLDLLVVTEAPVRDEDAESLVNATYPLFLRCGRQISPQFRTRADMEQPRDERDAAFLENFRRDAILLWRRPPVT
ncbi:MAG: nucleotidyltransferase domain-containing protein [Actinomycetota bacterium]|nr:nucleotidyltransferase domain-containing protein [Actinomycetota bacterium]